MSETIQTPRQAKPVVVVRKANSLKVAVGDSKEVSDAKTAASKYGGRLQITSKIFLFFGVLGIFMSLYGLVMAGHNVEWMVSRHIQKHHGGPQGPPPPPHGWFRGNRPQGPPLPLMADGPMTRTEFHLIDNVRIISFFVLLKSITLCSIGCKTAKAVKRSNSSFANLVFRKNLGRLAFLFVISMITAHFMKDTRNVFEDHMQKFNEKPREHQGRPQWRRDQPKPVFQDIEEMPMIEDMEEMPIIDDMEEIPMIEDMEEMPIIEPMPVTEEPSTIDESGSDSEEMEIESEN